MPKTHVEWHPTETAYMVIEVESEHDRPDVLDDLASRTERLFGSSLDKLDAHLAAKAKQDE